MWVCPVFSTQPGAEPKAFRCTTITFFQYLCAYMCIQGCPPEWARESAVSGRQGVIQPFKLTASCDLVQPRTPHTADALRLEEPSEWHRINTFLLSGVYSKSLRAFFLSICFNVWVLYFAFFLQEKRSGGHRGERRRQR